MAKLPRKLLQEFGANSQLIGAIGSFLQNVSTELSKDPDVIQTSAYQGGWEDITVGNTRAPEIGDLNSILYNLYYAIKEIQQTGIPEYLDTEEYDQHIIVKNTSNSIVYISKENNNIGNDLSDTDFWLAIDLTLIDTYLTTFNTANKLLQLNSSATVPLTNLSSATESARGIAQIATQAETTSGTNDTKFITPLKLAQAISLNQQGFAIYLNVYQTVINGVATKVNLGGVLWNVNNCYNTTTKKFQPTVAGFYFLMGACTQTDGLDVDNGIQADIYYNGAFFGVTATNVWGGQTASVGSVLYFNGTSDFAELFVTTYNSDGNLQAGPSTYMLGWRVGIS